MDKTKELFLELIKKYLGSGDKINCPDADISGLFRLAAAHKVVPWIFSAAANEGFFAAGDKDTAALFRRTALGAVAEQTARYASFLKLCSAMRLEGITPVVLKGLICDLLYPARDHRTTSDCDILIKKEELERCTRFFEQNGFTAVSSNSHEASLRSENGMLTVEIHTGLFDDDLKAEKEMERFFDGHEKSDITLTVDSTDIVTFCPTLHLIYLVFHALKHFARGGFGIRQLCDIALFARANAESLDYSLLFSALDSVSASVIFLNIEEAAGRFLGIAPPDEIAKRIAGCPFIDSDELVEDLLDAGVYGSSSEIRVHSSRITLSAMNGGGKLGGKLASLFPKADYMKKLYPFLVKFPFLLPLAWLMRIFSFAAKRRKTGKSPFAADVISLGEKRAELLKKYHLTE